MEEKKFNTLAYVVKCIFVIFIATLITFTILNEYFTITKKYKEQEIVNIDTITNKVIIDSISYNIKHRDSIITNYKTKIEYEKHKALNASDSDAIVMFYQLSAE